MGLELNLAYEQTEPGIFRSANWRSQTEPGPDWYDLPDGRHLQANRKLDNIFATRALGLFSRTGVVPLRQSGETSLTIRAYAHDRMVLTAAHAGVPPAAKRRRAKQRFVLHGPQGRVLERPRETQDKPADRGGHGAIPAPTKFTRHGSTMVRCAGHLIERDKQGKAVFLTLTIAGGGDDVYRAMSAFSGHLVNVFNTWLRDHAERGWYVYVWELQTRGAPHLHYMLSLPRNVSIRAFRKQAQAEWRRALCSVSRMSGTDLFKALDGKSWRGDIRAPWVGAKLCTHDLGRYMAKYASKSRSKAGHSTNWRPGRWWACSYPLRAAVMRERVLVKLKFPSYDAAQAALSRFLLLSAPHCGVAYKIPADKTYGATAFSVDTHVRKGKELALAMKHLFETGEVLPVLAMTTADNRAA
jgi:hypothetical protein